MCSRHVANVSRMVIQSIFTGTQGSGQHTTRTLAHTDIHTHTHACTHVIQHQCVDFTFVRQGFWFVASKCGHTSPHSLGPVCVYTWAFLFLSPLITKDGAESTYHRSRAGKEPPSLHGQGWAGNVRFNCFYAPFSYQSQVTATRPQGPAGGDCHPLPERHRLCR